MSQSPTSRSKQRAKLSAPTQITSSGLLPFLDISPDALLVVDQAGTIMTVNEQTEAIFGYARSELLSQQLEILLPGRFRDVHIAHREHYFSAPRTRQMGAGLQLSGKRKDGTEFPVDISLRPLLLDEALCVIAAVCDMTEQKRMEEELARHGRELERRNSELRQQHNELVTLNSALQEANRARSLFLSTMSQPVLTSCNKTTWSASSKTANTCWV